MAKVRYVGVERMTEVFGHIFHRDEWRPSGGENKHSLPADHLAVLADNPQFEVSEEEAAPVAAEPKPEPKGNAE